MFLVTEQQKHCMSWHATLNRSILRMTYQFPAYTESHHTAVIPHMLTRIGQPCRFSDKPLVTSSSWACLYNHTRDFTGPIDHPIHTMGKKRILVGYGVDIDAVAGWLGSYKGEDSTSDISRGLFAGSTGVRRLLKLFEKYNQKATFFIPGHR